MNFGKNLQILKMTNLTQEELAERMNVSRQTVSKWELGAILPEVEKPVKLCEKFNYSRETYSICAVMGRPEGLPSTAIKHQKTLG